MVKVDETDVQFCTVWYWLYAAVDLVSLYLLNIDLFRCNRADTGAAVLH